MMKQTPGNVLALRLEGVWNAQITDEVAASMHSMSRLI